MKLYALTEATMNETLATLAGLPFSQVNGLLIKIQNEAKLVVDGEGRAIEVDSEGKTALVAAPEVSPTQSTEATA